MRGENVLLRQRVQPEAVLDPPLGRAEVQHLFVFRVLPELLLPTRHVRVAAQCGPESYGVAAFKYKQPLSLNASRSNPYLLCY